MKAIVRNEESMPDVTIKDLIRAIDDAPIHPTKGIEIIMCKDCVHWGGVAYGFVCRKFSGIETKICMHADNFCSFAERKKNNA